MNVSVWILGNQLLEQHSVLERARAENTHVQVIMIESRARTRRLPYQSKKLVLLFSAMRHYAQLLREQGVQVDYRQSESTLAALHSHIQEQGAQKIVCMAASDFHGRKFQQRLEQLLDVPVQVWPNTQFLVEQYSPFPEMPQEKRVPHERFYRKMRAHFKLLMEENGTPTGGEWNYDKYNRKPLPAGIDIPAPQVFKPDKITRQVMQQVADMDFTTGTCEGFNLAVTHQQAQQALEDFIANRLIHFGPYEDAMSARERLLFHSMLSPYINLGLLEPLQMARAAEQAYRQGRVPLNSAEGFIRQVISWREYIYWQYWRLMPKLAQANFWEAQRSLPDFFWNADTDMNCLHIALLRALQEGYNHHIERLMLLSNFCLLAGVQPQQVNDWFLSVYVDAYEWVMAPNVFGMGLFADGGIVGSKPYISSANYINKMSDYCASCRYDHKKRSGTDACPFNFLYWNFLIQHEQILRANPRLGPNVLALRHLDENERAAISHQASEYLAGAL